MSLKIIEASDDAAAPAGAAAPLPPPSLAVAVVWQYQELQCAPLCPQFHSSTPSAREDLRKFYS